MENKDKSEYIIYHGYIHKIERERGLESKDPKPKRISNQNSLVMNKNE